MGHRLLSSMTDSIEERVADATGFAPPPARVSESGSDPWGRVGNTRANRTQAQLHGRHPEGATSSMQISRSLLTVFVRMVGWHRYRERSRHSSAKAASSVSGKQCAWGCKTDSGRVRRGRRSEPGQGHLGKSEDGSEDRRGSGNYLVAPSRWAGCAASGHPHEF
jgi:hypothetical protein